MYRHHIPHHLLYCSLPFCRVRRGGDGRQHGIFCFAVFVHVVVFKFDVRRRFSVQDVRGVGFEMFHRSRFDVDRRDFSFVEGFAVGGHFIERERGKPPYNWQPSAQGGAFRTRLPQKNPRRKNRELTLVSRCSPQI